MGSPTNFKETHASAIDHWQFVGYWKWSIQFVDLPIPNGDFPVRYVNVVGYVNVVNNLGVEQIIQCINQGKSGEINEYIGKHGIFDGFWDYSGWWYTYPSEKYEFSWDYDIPNVWEIKFMFQTTNQVSPIFGRSNRCANHSANHKIRPTSDL